MNTLPSVGDRVVVRIGKYKMIGLVIDTYDGVIGPQVVVRAPADPEPGEVTHTYALPVGQIDAAA